MASNVAVAQARNSGDRGKRRVIDRGRFPRSRQPFSSPGIGKAGLRVRSCFRKGDLTSAKKGSYRDQRNEESGVRNTKISTLQL